MAVPANALLAVATLEAELGITTGTQTALLERLIGVVSDAIEKYCGRNFGRAVIVDERVAGYGTQKLMVERTPVESIQSVKLETETIDSTTYRCVGRDAEAGLIFRQALWSNTAALSADVVPRPLPGWEERAYLVSYTAGYFLPAAGGSRNLPFDLEQAAIISAVATYRGRGKYSKLVEETEGSDAKLWYDYVLPPNARQLLSQYKRVRV